MDRIKEAFQKIKKDIDSLKQEIHFLREKIMEMGKIVNQTNLNAQVNTSTHKEKISTHSTFLPTHNSPLGDLKPQKQAFSTGNQGVPTDKQTNRQTNRHIKKGPLNALNSIEDAIEILDSLDSIKKEIRLKFKRLTEQEFLVFSKLYELDERFGYSNYKALSRELDLSESSIRDYIGRLIKKGIPIEKNKINNKNIQLFISKNLKKIVTLSTILQLRDL